MKKSGEEKAQHASAVQGICGQKIYRKQRKGDGRGEVGIGIGFGKHPPERDEENARRKVCERACREHAEKLLLAYPRDVSRDDRAVRHQDNFIEDIAAPSRGKGVRTLVFERGEACRKEGGQRSREGGEYPRRQKERVKPQAFPQEIQLFSSTKCRSLPACNS